MGHILIIEDTDFIRDELQAILEFEGYEVALAHDGKEGLKLALEKLPDLIVCDVMMPELDGYQVLSELRRNATTLTIPFIFMTVLHEREEIRKGMNLGADDYLLKPIRRRELIDTIQTRLQRHKVIGESYTSHEPHHHGGAEGSLNYDPLTGLPNHRFLQDWLAHEVRSNPEGAYLGVLVLELDRFRAVHHALGVRSGDELIRTLAERLRSSGLSQEATVFRTGESEFVVLLPQLPDQEAASGAAAYLLQQIRRPLPIGHHTLHLAANIGISLGPTHGMDPATLLGHAHLALHQAEEQGHGIVQMYRPGLKDRVHNRLTLETNLRQALQRRSLHNHYQAQVDLSTGRIFGFEALARWEDPVLGPVGPAEFIPMAESCGLIQAIGSWSLQTACSQLRALNEAGFEGLSMAVNLSVEQLKDRQIVEEVERVLQATGLAPSRLYLELTEGVLLREAKLRIDLLGDLRALGVRIALDDFGTGYSSLSYLKQLPLDMLKIDQSFVHDLAVMSEAAAITAAIITLGHSIGLQVLAEGVETMEQAALLRSQGCDAAQGYYYSRPQAPVDLPAVLVHNRKALPPP